MRQKFLILLVFAICSSFARPILFDIDKEINEAKRIVKGTIVSYDEENAQVTFLNSTTGKTETARAIGNIMAESPQESDARITNTNISILTGSVPMIGQEVLMVINETNLVRLFAYEADGYYRFWTQIRAGSVSLFKFELPALPLQTRNPFYGASGIFCIDGCLYPIDQIELKQ